MRQGMFTAGHPDLSGTFPIREGEEDTVMYLLVNKVFGAVTTLFNTILILPRHIWEPVVSETEQLNNKDPQGEFLELYEHPTGCGPWILVEEETNTQMITLRRNPDYHLRDDAGGSLYKVEKIKLLLYLSVNTAIFAIRKGYIDILDAGISSNYVSLLEQEENMYVSRSEGTSVTCLVLNTHPAPPFDSGDKLLLGESEFRRAIALAIDQEELIEKVLDGAGREAPAGLIRESNELLYEPASDFLPTDMPSRLGEANRILDARFPDKDEDGYRLQEDGSRVRFEVLTSAGAQDLVSYLQRQFQKIGIEIGFKASGSTPETTYLYRSDFDMTTQGVILSMANADVMFRAHFVTTERSSNYGKYRDEELAGAIEEMRHTLDGKEKVERIKEVEIRVAEAFYKLPLYCPDVLSVARTDRFTGYADAPGQTVFNTETLKQLQQVGGT